MQKNRCVSHNLYTRIGLIIRRINRIQLSQALQMTDEDFKTNTVFYFMFFRKVIEKGTLQ